MGYLFVGGLLVLGVQVLVWMGLSGFCRKGSLVFYVLGCVMGYLFVGGLLVWGVQFLVWIGVAIIAWLAIVVIIGLIQMAWESIKAHPITTAILCVMILPLLLSAIPDKLIIIWLNGLMVAAYIATFFDKAQR